MRLLRERLVVCFLALTLPLILLGFSPGVAAPRDVRDNEVKQHTDAVTYNDFHAIVTSDANIQSVYAVIADAGVLHNTPTITGEGTHTVQINWTGLDVPANDRIGITIEFQLEEWNTYDIRKQWTRTATAGPGPLETITEDTPALGLSVLDCGEYSLTNDYQEIIAYTGLEYAVVSDAMPLTADEMAQAMEASSGDNPFAGYAPAWTDAPDGVVPGGGEAYITSLGISEGQYLYSYFSEDFTDGSGDISATFQEHEHQAGGPSATENSLWGRIKQMFR